MPYVATVRNARGEIAYVSQPRETRREAEHDALGAMPHARRVTTSLAKEDGSPSFDDTRFLLRTDEPLT